MAKRRRKFIQCPNCGYTFEEVNNYCPNCGQENHDLNVPVKHLIEEFFESTLHYDTKFWRTLKYLLTRPGYLTEKFNIGQRASYVPPFRLYVFVSIFFFSFIALFSTSKMIAMEPEVAAAQLKETNPKAAAQLQKVDSLAAASGADVLVRGLPQADTSNQKISGELLAKFHNFTSNQEQSRQRLMKNVSFMMFVLMPFFGFILYLFYRSQRRNYVEHLMFSIHFHTFVFLLIMLALVVEYIFKGFDTDSIVFLISVGYLFLAMHRVYKQPYLRTAAKLIPISITYIISLMFLFVTTVAISVWLS